MLVCLTEQMTLTPQCSTSKAAMASTDCIHMHVCTNDLELQLFFDCCGEERDESRIIVHVGVRSEKSCTDAEWLSDRLWAYLVWNCRIDLQYGSHPTCKPYTAAVGDLSRAGRFTSGKRRAWGRRIGWRSGRGGRLRVDPSVGAPPASGEPLFECLRGISVCLHSSTQSSSALPLSSICLVTRSTHSS